MVSLQNILLFVQSYILGKEIDTSALFPHSTNAQPLEEIYKNLKSYSRNKISRIEYKGEKYPIYETHQLPQSRVLVFWGIHGNETSSYTASKYFSDFKKYQDLSFVGPLNPTGYVLNNRGTGNRVDPNRNIMKSSEVEIQAQKASIDKHSPKLVISLHEGPQDGVLLIVETKSSNEFKQKLRDALHASTLPLATKNIFGFPLKEKGVWIKQKRMVYLQKLIKLDTLGTYLDVQGINAVTIEIPQSLVLEEKNELQKKALEIILSSFRK